MNKSPSKSHQAEKGHDYMEINSNKPFKITKEYPSARSFTPNHSSLQSIFVSKLPLSELIHKRYDPMKIPFGYRSKRFSYFKTDNNGTELKGNQKKYFPITKNKSFTFLEMNTPLKEEERKYKPQKRICINREGCLDSSRTIYPERDIEEKKKIGKKMLHKSESVGSIKTLLEKTPTNPKIRPRNLRGRENNVFSEIFYTDISYKRQKSPVNWKYIKRKGDLAGDIGIQGHGITSYAQFYTHNNHPHIDNYHNTIYDGNINYARRIKIMSNMSDIFNVKKTANINKANGNSLKKELTFCFEEAQKYGK